MACPLFLLVMQIHRHDWWCLRDKVRRIHVAHTVHTYRKQKRAHTRSHTVVETLALWVCRSSRHLCLDPSAKILPSKIWLDIFQHWISRESRLALRRILPERHGKWEAEREEESSLKQATAEGRKSSIYPHTTGARGANLMSLYMVIKGSPWNDTLCHSVPKEN